MSVTRFWFVPPPPPPFIFIFITQRFRVTGLPPKDIGFSAEQLTGFVEREPDFLLSGSSQCIIIIITIVIFCFYYTAIYFIVIVILFLFVCEKQIRQWSS